MGNRWEQEKQTARQIQEMRKRLAVLAGIVCVALCLVYFTFSFVIPRVLQLFRGEQTYDGQPTSYWATALAGKSKELKWQEAARRLQAGGGQAVPVLAQLVQAEEALTRARAAKLLARSGSKDAVPALAAGQKDTDRDVRWWSAFGLAMIDPEGGAVNLPLLLEAGQSPDADLSKNINQAVAKLPTATRVPGLIEALQHADTHIRFQAVNSLGALGPEAKEAVPALIPLIRIRDLRDSEGYPLGERVVTAIGQINPEAREQAIQLYLKELQDPKGDRAGAAYALGRLRAKAAIKLLQQLLKDPDAAVKEQAISALGAIDPNLVDP